MNIKRPRLLADAVKIPELVETVRMLSEIDTKKNLSIPVEDLSNILVQCHNENMILREEILKLRKDTDLLTKNMGSFCFPKNWSTNLSSSNCR